MAERIRRWRNDVASHWRELEQRGDALERLEHAIVDVMAARGRRAGARRSLAAMRIEKELERLPDRASLDPALVEEFADFVGETDFGFLSTL
ncbi:MAG TPA: hypothetical protein VIL20_12390, partial [Sandaracinaceae bacterium]